MKQFPAASLAYLATPFSLHKQGLHAAFIEAVRISAALLKAGIKNYSPIAHTYGLCIHGELDPLDTRIWYPLNDEMLKRCDVLIVARMDGWKDSVGIAREIKFFRRAERPIYSLDPGTLTLARDVEGDKFEVVWIGDSCDGNV
jgi:hypothetical protein